MLHLIYLKLFNIFSFHAANLPITCWSPSDFFKSDGEAKIVDVCFPYKIKEVHQAEYAVIFPEHVCSTPSPTLALLTRSSDPILATCYDIQATKIIT